MAKVKSDRERLEYAFRLCLTRDPEADELEALTALLERQKQPIAVAVRGNVNTPSFSPDELAAWTMIGRVLLNLDEFITRE